MAGRAECLGTSGPIGGAWPVWHAVRACSDRSARPTGAGSHGASCRLRPRLRQRTPARALAVVVAARPGMRSTRWKVTRSAGDGSRAIGSSLVGCENYPGNSGGAGQWEPRRWINAVFIWPGRSRRRTAALSGLCSRAREVVRQSGTCHTLSRCQIPIWIWRQLPSFAAEAAAPQACITQEPRHSRAPSSGAMPIGRAESGAA